MQALTAAAQKAQLGETTGIQTVPKAEAGTESSVRFGKTDIRRVREVAEDNQSQHPKTADGNRKRKTETVENNRSKRATTVVPNRKRWLIPAVGFLMMIAVWLGIQSRIGKPFVKQNSMVASITSNIWGTQTPMTVTRAQSAPTAAAEETPIMQETAQVALMQVADILTSIQTQTKIKIDEAKKNNEATEAVLQREATVSAAIGLTATAAVQTVIAEKQRAAEEALSQTATEAAFQYAAAESVAAGLTATADVAILSTKIAQTVIAENRLAAEEMSNQTATAEQKAIYNNETLTALNQRLTETKATVRINHMPTPPAPAAVATERVSEECEPWPTSKTQETLFSFYGNRIDTNINPNRILGAMAVVRPPESAIGKDWEISVSDYSDKLPAKIHASVRYACSLISGNLHCGPFDYLYIDNHNNANLSFDSFKSLVHVYPKGMDCEVYTAEISYHLFDQVRNSLGSGGAGQNSGDSVGEEESPGAPGPSGGSEPGAYDISP